MAPRFSKHLNRSSIVSIPDTKSSISMKAQISKTMAFNSNGSISGTNSSSNTNMEVKITIEVEPSALEWKNGEVILKLNKNKLQEIQRKYQEILQLKKAQKIIEITPPSSCNNSSNGDSQLCNLTPREYYEIQASRRFICAQDTRLNESYACENRPRTKSTRHHHTQDILPNIPQARLYESSPKPKENLSKSRQADDKKELEEIIQRAVDRNKSPEERAFAELINNGAEISFESIPATPEHQVENRCWETAENNWLTPNLSPILKE